MRAFAVHCHPADVPRVLFLRIQAEISVVLFQFFKKKKNHHIYNHAKTSYNMIGTCFYIRQGAFFGTANIDREV